MAINLDLTVRDASSGIGDFGGLDDACMRLGCSPFVFGDAFLHHVATAYLAHHVEWGEGHRAVNLLFRWACREGGSGLSDFGWYVYAAFYLGEDRHQGQPDDTGSDYYAVPLLVHAVSKCKGIALLH